MKFDSKQSADVAISQLDQTVPAGATEAITVKIANPSQKGAKVAVQVRNWLLH